MLGSGLFGQVHGLANRPCWACASACCQGSDGNHFGAAVQILRDGFVVYGSGGAHWQQASHPKVAS